MKFVCLVVFCLGLQVHAKVLLWNKTNPITSTKDCLKSVDTVSASDDAAIKLANEKIHDCLMEGANADHYICSNGAKRIRNNKELQDSALDYCKMNYSETLPCVKHAETLNDAAKKKAKTRECVTQNYAYFSPDFCLDLLSKAGLEQDSELIQTCTAKPENSKPAGDSSKSKSNRR